MLKFDAAAFRVSWLCDIHRMVCYECALDKWGTLLLNMVFWCEKSHSEVTASTTLKAVMVSIQGRFDWFHYTASISRLRFSEGAYSLSRNIRPIPLQHTLSWDDFLVPKYTPSSLFIERKILGRFLFRSSHRAALILLRMMLRRSLRRPPPK